MSDFLTGQLDHYAKQVFPNYPDDIVSQGKREIERLRAEAEVEDGANVNWRHEAERLREQLVKAREHIHALLGLELGSGEKALAFLEQTDEQGK